MQQLGDFARIIEVKSVGGRKKSSGKCGNGNIEGVKTRPCEGGSIADRLARRLKKGLKHAGYGEVGGGR